MQEELIRRVSAYLEEHREEMIADLTRLCRIPSVRAEAQPGAPFGRACRACLDEAVRLFRSYGFEAEVSADGKYAVGRWGGPGPVVGIFGHTDVVPVSDGWRLTQPFEPVVCDGCLVARGAEDDKSGVITALYVMRCIRDLQLPMKGSVLAFIGSNEETDMEDIDAFVAQMPMPDVSIVPDNAYPVCLGEKGICQLIARSRMPLLSLRRFAGGLACNVVLDHVEAEAARPELEQQFESAAVGREGVRTEHKDGRTLLVADGLSQHASTPEGSVNAAKRAAEALCACSALPEQDRELFGAFLRLLCDDYGTGLGIAAQDERFGRLTATNGMVELSPEGNLLFSLDIRYGSSTDPDRMLQTVREHLDRAGFEAVRIDNRPGFHIPADSGAARLMCEIYRAVSGDATAMPVYSGGGTYCRHLVNAFSVGTWMPGEYRKPDLPVGHGGPHQPDEYLPLEGFFRSVLAITLMTLAMPDAL